jgi:anti-sigma regulatory factor (Ser/Thr protein kinase)
MPQAVSITLVNRLSEIEKVTQLVESFGDEHTLPRQLVFNFTLALDEVLTNVINYGYADEGEHPIVVRLACDGREVSAEVQDEGRPFNPLEAKPPDIEASLEDRPIGGLGVYIVRTLMDALDYRRENGRNILIMSKRLTDRDGSGPPDGPAS